MGRQKRKKMKFLAGYSVYGKLIGQISGDQISGQISIRSNPSEKNIAANCDLPFVYKKLMKQHCCAYKI